jgi:hypothetical protein
MDPITIGALAIAAGSAAYKMYKANEAEDAPAPAGGNPMARLKQLQSQQPGAAPPTAGVQLPAAPAASPMPPPVFPSPVQTGGYSISPLDRLRQMQGGF